MSENSENLEKSKNSLEIPENSAPPLEKLVEGEAAPGNPETRAQIQVPEEKEEAPAKPKKAENSENPQKVEKNWAEVAKGKRGRPRKNPLPEVSPEMEAAKAEKARLATEQKIRANKAAGIVTVSELGLLYLARRFGASEDEIKFHPDEKKALQEAIEPLVSAETEDPWGNLMMVAMAVGGPRVASIAAARQAKLESEAAAESAARGEDEPWRAVA